VLPPWLGMNLIQFPTNTSGRGWAFDGASSTQNQGHAPDGTNSLSTIIDSTASQRHIAYQGGINPPAGTYTFSVYLKQNTLRYAQLLLAGTTYYGVVFDLQQGVVTTTTSSGSPVETATASRRALMACGSAR